MVGAEALAEQVAVLGALPREEGAIRHVAQLALRLPACDGPPGPARLASLSSSVRLATPMGPPLRTESDTLGAELRSKFKWQHMLSATWAPGQASPARVLRLRSVCMQGGSRGVCVRVGGGGGGGVRGPPGPPQALHQDPRGAHQQAAHWPVCKELGGHDEVRVGRMLVVLRVVAGEGAPGSRGWDGRDLHGGGAIQRQDEYRMRS